MKSIFSVCLLTFSTFMTSVLAQDGSVDVIFQDGSINKIDSNVSNVRFGSDKYDGESIGKIIKYINDNRDQLVKDSDNVTKLYFRPDFSHEKNHSNARIFVSNGTASIRLGQALYVGGEKREFIPIEGADVNVYITGLKEMEGRSNQYNRGVIQEISSSLVDLGREDIEVMKEFYTQKSTSQISLSSQIRIVDFFREHGLRQVASELYDQEFMLWMDEQIIKLMLEDNSLFERIQKKTKLSLSKIVLKDSQTGHLFGFRLENVLGMPASFDFTFSEKGELELVKINNRTRHVTVNIYRGTSFNLTKTKKRSGLSFDWFNKEPEGGFFRQKDYDIALINLSKVVEYFKGTFNWVSFDNRGSDLNATVRFKGSRLLGTAGLRQNAAWAGAPYNQFLFGRGGDTLDDFLSAFDVIGHEFCHAIVAHTANLEGGNEVGALNEHVCDILGVGFEGDLSGKGFDFKIGEQVVQGSDKGLRDFLRPELSFSDQPSHMRQVNAKYGPYCVPTQRNDECGVHYSNGVLNKAVGMAIQNIGWSKYKNLLFEVVTKKLNSKSDFKNYALQTVRTCNQMNEMSQDDCNLIERSFASVGVTVGNVGTTDGQSGQATNSNSMNDLDLQLCEVISGTCSLFEEGSIYDMCVKCGHQY
jgi:hypothetical protein